MQGLYTIASENLNDSLVHWLSQEGICGDHAGELLFAQRLY